MRVEDSGNSERTTPFPEQPGGLKALLSRRYFRRLWFVTAVSSLGDWLAVFALAAYVGELSGRPELAVGGVLLFRVVPGMFFGPFAGVLADRFDRRRVMVTADVLRALFVFAIPFVDDLVTLFAISAILEMLNLLWTPSKDATVPNLVEREQLLPAAQLNIITTYATLPLGGALVAFLVIPATLLANLGGIFGSLEQYPVHLAFFINGATFVFSGAMIATFPKRLMVSAAARQPGHPFRPFRDMAEGLRFVKGHPMVRSLMMGAWIAFLGGSAVISLGPVLAAKFVRGGSSAQVQAAWGALIVAVGVGLVSGMVLAGRIGRVIKRETLFPIGLIGSGVMTVIVATRIAFVPAVIATGLAGFGVGLAWVTTFALLQERVDDRLRGRTFATLYTGIQFALFAGLATWPFVAGAIGNREAQIGDITVDLAGSRIALVLGGTVLVAAGVLALRLGVVGKTRASRRRGLRLGIAGGASRPGLFISFEGGEGAGKSTQMQATAQWLMSRGMIVLVTREPGGTEIAERIRGVLLDPDHSEMDYKTEALLYAASRAQHVSERIRPALEEGKVVLCDRYIDSSLAYQGGARGLGIQDILNLNVWATDELLPDLVVLLHLEPGAGFGRKDAERDRMEQEELAFHEKVSDSFLQLARQYPSRFVMIDASGPIEVVQSQIRTALLPFLEPIEAAR